MAQHEVGGPLGRLSQDRFPSFQALHPRLFISSQPAGSSVSLVDSDVGGLASAFVIAFLGHGGFRTFQLSPFFLLTVAFRFSF